MKKFVLKKEEPAIRAADYNIPYADILNAQQLKAVFFDKGSALVIAGAGTGKTRTLIHRVARLVESRVNPSNILLLTFTRRAASEMINRASSILDERCKQIKGGTFHYYCSQILHRYAERIGFPENFTIIDTADSLEVIQHVRGRLKLNKKEKRFPNKSTLLKMISTAKNKHLDLKVVLGNGFPQFIEQIDAIEDVWEGYEQYKHQNYVMDFDDLLIKSRDLLSKNDDIRIKVAANNEYLMVDEYQDTNRLQAELTALFSSVHSNVMAVGDDAQSIYSFRGADHQNIMQFPDLFKNTTVIKLEENYRSSPQILTVANKLLEQAHFKFEKFLFSNNVEGEKPALVKAGSEHEQSRFVSQAILQLREQGIELNDMAVLFRNGRDSFDLEIELNRKSIPFVKYGGQKFTEAAHIKDVLAHVRVLVNPMDSLAWNRVLMLIDGIGPKSAEELFIWIRMAQNPFELNLNDGVSKAYVNQLKALSALLIDINDSNYDIPEILEKIVDYYRVFCEKRYDDYPKRLKDLEVFVNISVNYHSLSVMLEELALDPLNATVVDTEQQQADEAPLVLSTIHSAKGLEWDQVFIIQCLDGVLPSLFSVEEDEQLDEELRLLYVAATRAKSMLFFSYPAISQSVYGDYFTKPSRFLDELDKSVLEEWMLVEENMNPFPESEQILLE